MTESKEPSVGPQTTDNSHQESVLPDKKLFSNGTNKLTVNDKIDVIEQFVKQEFMISY